MNPPSVTAFACVSNVPVTPELIAINSRWGVPVPAGGEPGITIGTQPATAAVMQSVGAFPLVPGAGDSALVVTLPPGNYTVEVGDVEVGTTGLALLEIYEIP